MGIKLSNRNRANHTGTQPWNTITGTPTTTAGYGITDASTFSAPVSLTPLGTNAGDTTPLRFYELVANGTNFVAFKAPDALAADTTYTLPNAFPATSGFVLSSTTGGVMSWTDAATAAQGAKADTAVQPAAIGSTILAYDANLQTFVNTFTLPTTDGTSGQSLVTNGAGALSFAEVNAATATTATNVAGGAAGSLVYQTGAATTSTLALGIRGYVLRAGASAPEWAVIDGGTF